MVAEKFVHLNYQIPDPAYLISSSLVLCQIWTSRGCSICASQGHFIRHLKLTLPQILELYQHLNEPTRPGVVLNE